MTKFIELINLQSPCNLAAKRVDLTASSQEINFKIDNPLCDGCQIRLKVKNKNPLQTSLEITDPAFNGNCLCINSID
jgi:TPP-dependent indolepyruvate ferredoxin oxidoreductase alpha subunit